MQPLFLKPGDHVGIVAPAGKFKRESLDKGTEVVSSWGLNVKLGKNILSHSHSYLSGSDDERLSDLQSMLDDTSLSAIFCARGGYGTTRIIDQLDFSSFLQYPKWIVGFSDITALHLKLHQLGIESIHGSMPLHYFKPEHAESTMRLKNLLFGKSEHILSGKQTANRFGNAQGELIGGNLSLLADALGTNTSPETKNKILIIEEIGEYKYKIDRMLMQLKRAGKLDSLAGLVIGYMTDIKNADPGFKESIEDIVMDKVKEYVYPVAFNFPIGHDAPNVPWISGADAHLAVNESGSRLEFVTNFL